MQRKELSTSADPETEDSGYVSTRSLNRSTSAEIREKGYLIEFENINFTLKNGTTIMKGVYGSFKPGRLCAIMGPSGAGKSTIIGLVTGKTERTGGTVKLNGEVVPGLMHIRKIVGFVPQEDVMIRQLSVRDNITFSARFRLPTSTTPEEIDDRVNECLFELGIPHVQHTPIGDDYTRGISGGQRKRVNIAIEMIADPSVLFLDEPTSGLDSTTTVALIDTLKNIAVSKNMTISSVIHQPSYSAFLMFDDLLLLGKGGQVVYHGSLGQGPDYFASIGFPLPSETNPSDFYLDVISGVVKRIDYPDFKAPQDLFALWEAKRSGKAIGSDDVVVEVVDTPKVEESKSCFSYVVLVKDAFVDLFWYWEEWLEELHELAYSYVVDSFCCRKDPIRQTPSGLFQFYICMERALKQQFTGFRPFILEMAVHLMIGLVVSFTSTKCFYAPPLPKSVCSIQDLALQNICSLPPVNIVQFQTVSNFAQFAIVFASVAMGAGTFQKETPNYWREASAGLQTFSYFYAKFFANIIRIAVSAVFFFVAFTINFTNPGSGGKLYAIILVSYFFGFSLGYLTSQCVSEQYVAITGVMLALIFCLAFSGSNPTLTQVYEKPKSLQRLWSLSGPRWANEAFYINSVEYYQYIPSGSSFSGADYMNIDAQLNNFGYNMDYFASDIGAVILCGIGWGFIAVVIMAITNLEKKK